jgi:hypothetical protein
MRIRIPESKYVTANTKVLRTLLLTITPNVMLKPLTPFDDKFIMT